MPELPEVETVRSQLEREIIGATLVKITVRDARCFEGEMLSDSQLISEVLRLGKYLFVKFESGRGLQIHLKMTGRLILEDANKKIKSSELDYDKAIHTRVVLQFADQRKIYYWDTRMFGYIKSMPYISRAYLKIKSQLGPEPWDINDTELLRKLQKTGRTIKEAILDQGLLAGVGNIYANDGLWLAQINPTRKANTIKLSEVKKLRESLCIVLERGLETGGASDNTYRDFYGGIGRYQNEFLTYGRTGEPCNRCGSNLERIVVGGRGTWVCSKCQN